MTPIGTLRDVLYRLLAGAPQPVYKYLPGSADDLPCLVVGRPDAGTDDDVAGMVRATCNVFAFGRRDNDDDAQAELDSLGDYLLSTFWTPDPVEGLVVLLDDVTATHSRGRRPRRRLLHRIRPRPLPLLPKEQPPWLATIFKIEEGTFAAVASSATPTTRRGTRPPGRPSTRSSSPTTRPPAPAATSPARSRPGPSPASPNTDGRRRPQRPSVQPKSRRPASGSPPTRSTRPFLQDPNVVAGLNRFLFEHDTEARLLLPRPRLDGPAQGRREGPVDRRHDRRRRPRHAHRRPQPAGRAEARHRVRR